MAFDWAARRAMATGLINKYGSRAILRREGVDRDCMAFVESYSRPAPGDLRNAPERMVLMSADGLAEPPDAEKDHLVLVDPGSGDEVENLRLIAPINKFAPGGVTVYWEMQARRR